MPGTQFNLEVQPRIPEPLRRLEELADDLIYAWERPVRRIFRRLEPELWEACGHNPTVFLRRVSQAALDEAAQDRQFLSDFHRVLSYWDTYMAADASRDVKAHLNTKEDLVAYFCAEFGLHESLPIYSGGLGILAGDHCKAASDLGVPFVAIGLMYRQGYFDQTIDIDGQQIATHRSVNFADLPANPVLDGEGNELRVEVTIEGRPVRLRIWTLHAGHIRMYLLDSDLPENTEADRSVTHRLYGGGITNRIRQEIVLGMGGVRALRALGLSPTVWHINEGHAAFQVLERCRELVSSGWSFDAALNRVAACTVFTTHTPVPAGHDIFPNEQFVKTLPDLPAQLGISEQRLLGLGTSAEGNGGFNMTSLALHGSRFHNGVSRIHGEVASQMERGFWPQVPPEENPIGHITNGVHVPTFLAREMSALFDMRFGPKWRAELRNPDFWHAIEDIPDHVYHSVRLLLKTDLMMTLRRRIIRQQRRNGMGEASIARLTRFLRPDSKDVLLIGFARRFATYKRADLVFSDPDRLARLLGPEDRPVVMVFGGKAHPNDEPGKALIKKLHTLSRQPQFEGRVLVVEGYGMALGRQLVAGVDVWLNTPEHPMEASGTSGQKAGINGVLNLSVLDGWWAEGYDGSNGWGVTGHDPSFDRRYRDQEEAWELLELLENKVIPDFFSRDKEGLPRAWLRQSKAAMRTTIPRFNAERMVIDYVSRYYGPAAKQARAFREQETAVRFSEWRHKVNEAWPRLKMRRLDAPQTHVQMGKEILIEVALSLAGLSPEDLAVECVLYHTRSEQDDGDVPTTSIQLTHAGQLDSGEALFRCQVQAEQTGLKRYKLRAYPTHPLQCHRFETGQMLWL